MESIINEELKPSASSSGHATYNDQRTLISSLFCKENHKYSKDTILLRLTVIDSRYSTHAAYSYFSFDNMADAILNLGDEKTAKDYFYSIATGGKDTKNLFNKKYGIRKNLSSGSQQMSLMSKYAYYALLQNKETYPLGFPIYDRLAKEAYPTVCNMLHIEDIFSLPSIDTPFIEEYICCLDKIRVKLFNNTELFLGYQQYDILDAYLWRMGKFEEGNLSLLLKEDEYRVFVKMIGLSAVEYNGSIEEYNKKKVEYYITCRNSRLITEEQFKSIQPKITEHKNKKGSTKTVYSFNFNKAVMSELEKADTNLFSNAYINKLHAHWRDVFHKEKNKGIIKTDVTNVITGR